MVSLINQLLALPDPILHFWGYWVVFLAAFFEAIPLLGAFIPGHTIVIASGFLVREGILGPFDTFFLVTFAAALGDAASFELGRRYGHDLLTRYGKYFFFHEERYGKIRKLIKENPAKTIIIGRFNLVTRGLAPFVAGTSELTFFRFSLYNIAGAASWTASSLVIGYLFGASYEVAAKYFGRAIFIAFVSGIALTFLYRYLNQKRHLFERFHVYTLSLTILSTYVFSKMVEDVSDSESTVTLDHWVNQNMPLLRAPHLTSAILNLTAGITGGVFLIFCLGLLAIFVYKKKWYHSILLVLSLGGGLLINGLTKTFLHRMRPPDALLTVPGFSFPSGHALFSTIFFVMIYYGFKNDIKNPAARYLFLSAMIVLFLAVGFSRIYLGAHWLSDVIGGISLGIFWITLLILILRASIGISRKIKKALAEGTSA